MSDVIGRGVIEVSADASKMNAAIGEARRSIASLGEASKNASASSARSIDRYVQSLQTQTKAIGKSTREQELYKLALRGASDEQLKAANSALQIKENYDKGLKATSNLKTGLIAVSAAAVAAVVGIGKLVFHTTNVADEMGKLSQKTGVSVESLSALAYAGELSDVSIDALGSGLKKLSINLSEAAVNAKGTAGQAFRSLGIDVKNASGELRSSDEVFADIAEKFSGVQDGAEKTAKAVALFGKAGADMIPMLNSGRDGLAGMKAEAEKFGLIMSGDLAKSSEQFNDNMTKIKLSLSTVGITIANDLLPSISSLSEEYLKAKRTGLDFVDALIELGLRSPGKSHRENIQNIDKEVAALEKWIAANGNATASMIEANKQAIIRKAQAREYFLELEREAALKGADTNYRKEGHQVTAPVVKKPAGFGPDNIETTAARIEKIRRLTDQELNIYGNAEKVIEAMHAARNVEEGQYYEAKLSFISINSQAQEYALKKEIVLLQQEKLSGQDKIDNAKKIADAQAKLSMLRANASAGIVINSIQEEAAIKKIEMSYFNAELAAKRYLSTIQRQAERDVAGIGKGTAFREDSAARKEIEERQTAQRQKLEDELRVGQITEEQFKKYAEMVESTYRGEVLVYKATRAEIKEKEGDWLNGANEASQNFLTNAENVSRNSAAMFTSLYDGMLDGISSSFSKAIVYGDDLEKSLTDVAYNIADSFIAAFIKIQIQKLFIDKAAAASGAAGIIAQAHAVSLIAGQNAYASTMLLPGGPALAPEAGVAAFAGAEEWATAITSAALGAAAARELGGPVSAGSLYRVNEKGPELLSVGGKDFLMMGSQAGNVTANNKIGGSNGSITVHSPMVFNIDGRLDRVATVNMIRSAVQQGNAQLVDTLERQGRL